MFDAGKSFLEIKTRADFLVYLAFDILYLYYFFVFNFTFFNDIYKTYF